MSGASALTSGKRGRKLAGGRGAERMDAVMDVFMDAK